MNSGMSMERESGRESSSADSSVVESAVVLRDALLPLPFPGALPLPPPALPALPRLYTACFLCGVVLGGRLV